MVYKDVVERGKRLDGIRYQIWFEDPYFGNCNICCAFSNRTLAESFIDYILIQYSELSKDNFHLIDLYEDA